MDIEHPGQQRMMELIKRNYWWLGIKTDVKKYVQGCFKYQQNKVQHMKKAGELHPLKTPEGPWKEISIDIIGPLPKSNRKDTIVVIVDRFTKMICLKVTTTNVSSEEIAKIYQDKTWKLHGVPRAILSNRGPQFASRYLWKGDITVQTEFPKLEEFLIGLQRSWEEAIKAMEGAQETMKKQFDKKRRNSQGLQEGESIWLEAKNIHSNRPSKKLDQKRYRSFKILKAIRQGAFQLELPTGWMIHNMFNEDLLTRCQELYYKGQHMELALPLDIVNEEEEYKMDEIRKHQKKGRGTQFLVHWKGYGDKHNQ